MKLTDTETRKIMMSARGEDCTLRLPTVCRNNTDTVVWCHFPDYESHGMGIKSFVLSGGYGCYDCHARIDGRINYQFEAGDKDFYMRRSQTRTLRRMIEKGVLLVK